MSIPGVFRAQARACEALGSPFTARLLMILAEMLHPGTAVFDRVLNWQGDPTSGGDSVPLRLAGGLHALVLSGKDDGLTGCYPPNIAANDQTFRAALSAALTLHKDLLLQWLDSPPQTNEVARSAVLVAAGQSLASRFDLPLRLLELGSSAGLNLYWDQVRLMANGQAFGPRDAPIELAPDWQGDLPPAGDLRIASRAGVDLNPLDPAKATDRLRMLSYIWPDQTIRLARLQQALTLAQAHPVKVAKGDAAGWISRQLAQPHAGQVTVVFHTIAWQYFPKSTQAAARAAIETAGAGAKSSAPVAWLAMEADGRADGAAVSLRIWPGGKTLDLGRADFHGRWLRWHNP